MRRIQTLTIAAVTFASLSGYGPEPVPMPEPRPEPPVIVVEASAPTADARWLEWMKAETLIRDSVLAETVALAIEDASHEFNLNPRLLASLIRIESSGRPSVVSKAGAVGLTQVLPGTAVEIAAQLELSEYDLFDPATNVRMGAFYLARLLERFDGSERSALAAYNYGPTAVSRMIRKGKPIPVVYASKILSR
jgi:soluble lytic murein transglycosylase-like protein